MKKNFLKLLCASVFLCAAFLVVVLHNPTVNSEKTPEVLLAQTNNDDADTDPITVIYTDASLTYYDDRALTADAEIIVIGTVKRVIGYTDEMGGIRSYVDLAIEDVLKGETKEPELRYSVMGGAISALDYYKANEKKISGKFGSESYEAQISGLKQDDVIERIFMGVKNVKEGDRVLIFAIYSKDAGCYVVPGTAYFGQRFYDEKSDQFYQIINDEKSLAIHRDELCKLIESTPDNSENVRSDMEMPEVEKSDTKNELTPRDPAYDKYKED